MLPSSDNPAPAPFTAQWAPCIHPGLIVDEAARPALFLLHPREPRWALTNASGLRMARRFDGTATLGALAGETAAQHGISQEHALGGLVDFARQLHDANLLQNLPLDTERTVRYVREPHRLTVYITEECNLRCRHCFVVEGKMPAPRLTGDDVRRLIDQHLERFPGALVSFSGGEVFVRPDAMDLVRHAAGRAAEVSLNTNGLLIDSSIAAELARLGVWVQVSLDGADPELHDFLRGPGTFEKAWSALQLLSDAGMASRTRTATTLTRCTVSQVRQLVERIEPLGLHEMRFLALNKMKAAVTNWGAIEPDPAELLDIYRYLLLELPFRQPPPRTRIQGDFPGFVPHRAPSVEHWCPLGETSIVDSQGHVYPCPTLLSPEYRTGNILDRPLAAIQDGTRARALRATMVARQYVLPECRACAWRNFCQGGCQAFSQLRSGTPWATDEFCGFRRELYREYALRRSGGASPHTPAGPECSRTDSGAE